MNRTTLKVLALSLLTSASHSETYLCRADLDQIGRPGETEDYIYTRNKYGFTERTYFGENQAQIALENERHIILIRPKEYGALMFSFIDKKRLEFGTHALSIEWIEQGKKGLFGNCASRN